MIEQTEEIFSRLQNFLCWTWLSLGGDVAHFWQYEINKIYKSWDYFLLEQKNNVLIKETEKPKGNEANAKKTEQGVDGLTFCLSCSN